MVEQQWRYCKGDQQYRLDLPFGSGELIKLVGRAYAAQNTTDDQVCKLVEREGPHPHEHQRYRIGPQFHNARNPARRTHNDGQDKWRLAKYRQEWSTRGSSHRTRIGPKRRPAPNTITK
jgi:hypothetical protein